jgi:elongation factor P hydroxylase
MTSEQIKSQEIINVFHFLFKEKYKTIIQKGHEEPFYQSSKIVDNYNIIIYANDSLSSLFHEISHWLVAGEERRKEDDYGYWYLPDGRNQEQQEAFFQLEIKPQALEWILSKSADHSFQLSLDNLKLESIEGADLFENNVKKQIKKYIKNGLPKRANLFQKELIKRFGNNHVISEADFILCRNHLANV